MTRSSLFVPVALAVAAASPPAYAVSEIDSCPAERYQPCSFFAASVALGENEQLIDNHIAGFTRSKGSWTISVRYQPETQCAKVNIFVDMGPIDSFGEYKEDLRNGMGEISDSGTFMHKIDNLESALRIVSSSCRTPYQAASKPDTAASDDETLDGEERGRLALEERRALEEERERLAFEEERNRLALEAAQKRRRINEARERERRRAEQERSHRLAEQQRERERRRAAQERATQLAEQQRERERIARLQREREEATAQGSALNTIITGFGLGALVGSAITGDDEVFDAASRLLSQSAGSTYVPSHSDSSGGSGCEQIGKRLARNLESLSGSSSMCTIYSGTARAYSQARNELAATGCASSQELADLDEAIAQARSGARSVCN